MPGNAKERHHAEEEGAQFVFLTAPVEFLDKDADGHVDSMRMIRMELGEPDDSGRRRPVPVEGSEYEVDVDAVALAIGYWPDPLMGETTPDLEYTLETVAWFGSCALAPVMVVNDKVYGRMTPDKVKKLIGNGAQQ